MSDQIWSDYVRSDLIIRSTRVWSDQNVSSQMTTCLTANHLNVDYFQQTFYVFNFDANLFAIVLKEKRETGQCLKTKAMSSRKETQMATCLKIGLQLVLKNRGKQYRLPGSILLGHPTK